jgi:exonuclease VII small subunit
MAADVEGSVANLGGWAATEGPQSFFWGGTWICAATGTDNAGLIKDIMLTLTTNEEVMTNIVKQDDDFVNNKPAMEAMAADAGYQSKVLGGQNPLAMYAAGAENIDLSNLSPYDQGCNEEFQRAMKNYFDGNATLDEALDLFYKGVEEKYPGLTH